MEKETLKVLCEVSQRLLHMGVSQKQMFDSIRTTLEKEIDNMPKIKVLYSTSPTTFALTQEFTSFIFKDYDHMQCSERTVIEYYPERIYPVQFLLPFGKHIATQYRYASCMIHNYLHYDFDQIFSLISRLKRLNARLEQVDLNVNSISAALVNEAFGDNDKPVTNKFLAHPLCTEHFTKRALERMIDEHIPSYKKELNQQKQEIFDDLTVNFTPKQIEQMMNISYDPPNRSSQSFQDAVNRFGECSPHIWLYTHQRFNIKAMIFISQHIMLIADAHFDLFQNKPFYYSHPEFHRELALTFAADDCKLNIAEVPSALSWKIERKDGYECITYL